jgi:DNA-binding NtrC family response regulator
MQAGAFDYLSKPFELEELLIAIRMAEKSVRLEGRLRVREYERKKEKERKKLIGSSEAMHRIREQMKLAAASEANVLITGETGVGKNVVAEGIHDLQTRRENLLTINCSTVPENLMESEYFGHEKGVFTGAESRREGIFELADGGTLILDEIGEIPLHLQSKLLTVLEDKRIRRIGSGRSFPVDVRIVATTNQELERHIEEKRFRQDLYYRLAVFHMHIPPLRHHAEDVPEIARFFLNRFTRPPITIPDEQMARMKAYPWPGNVRELRNVMERACLLRQGNRIKPADLLWTTPTSGRRETPPEAPAEILPLERVAEEHIREAVRACSGNKSRAARLLGISLSTLKRRLRKMGDPDQNGPNGSL